MAKTTMHCPHAIALLSVFDAFMHGRVPLTIVIGPPRCRNCSNLVCTSLDPMGYLDLPYEEIDLAFIH